MQSHIDTFARPDAGLTPPTRSNGALLLMLVLNTWLFAGILGMLFGEGFLDGIGWCFLGSVLAAYFGLGTALYASMIGEFSAK